MSESTNPPTRGSAASVAAASGTGATLMVRPGEWSAVNFPATATAASASKTAGASGVRHVCTSLTFSFGQPTSAPVAYLGAVVLRDGATGAGTIIWEAVFACPATAAELRTVTVAGLNIFGSAATAMTAEFTSAGGTATQQGVTLAGYDVG